jgi:hypothetical protein
LKKVFGLLFGMCRSHHAIETKLHEERKTCKKLQKDMKKVKQSLYPNRNPSPPSFEERESNPPTPFEQRYASYESFDLSHPFAPYAGTSHMGFHSQLGGDFGHQGPSSASPPPPHPEQPRPSVADEIAASIFGDPNPAMASSSHASLQNNTMPSFFDSSIYTGPGAHWTAPHDYAPDDQ